LKTLCVIELDLKIELDDGPLVVRRVTRYLAGDNTGTVMIGRDVHV